MAYLSSNLNFTEIIIHYLTPPLARKYLNQIEAMYKDCTPVIQELSATRIAEVDPYYALRLTKNITEPYILYDFINGIENPNKGRCVFRIFRDLANRDLTMAETLAEKNEDVFENTHANLAIGTAILSEDPSKAFKFFNIALSEIKNDVDRSVLLRTLVS